MINKRQKRQEEWQIVLRARAGDLRAFEELVKRYQIRLFHVAYKFVNNEEDAKDIVQESFLRAYKALSKFKGTSNFYTWIYRISVNLCMDHHRKGHANKLIPLPDNINELSNNQDEQITAKIPDPIESYRKSELYQALWQAINSLPKAQRTVLVLQNVEGLSREEIAEIMNCPLETVKSRLALGRAKLKERLKGYL